MSSGTGQPEEERGGGRGGLASTVFKGAGMAAGGYAFAQGINLLVYLVLARLISPGDFGVYAAASVLLGFLSLITDSGIASALIHRDDRLEEAFATATVATLIGGLVLSLAALALAPVIGLFFDSGRVEGIAAAMSGIVFFHTAISVPSAILQRNFSFLRRMVVEPAQVLAFGIVAIVGAAIGWGPWALVAGQYAGGALDLILCWVLVDYRPALRLVSWRMYRELAGYGRHVLFATLILRSGESADTVIVGKGLGEAALGQFRYAVRLATTPFQLLLAASAYVLFPAFARIADDAERFRAALLRSLRWTAMLGMPAGLIMVPLGVPLAVLLFGDVWRDAGYATMAMGLFTGAAALDSLASEALKAAGRPDRLTRMHTATAVATVVAMIALQPLGLSAVALGISIGAVFGAALGLFYMVRVIELGARSLAAEIWPPLVAALVMAGTITPLEFLVVHAADRATLPGLLLLAGEGLLAIGVYLAALRVLAPATVAELLDGMRRAPAALRRAIGDAPDDAALDAAEAPLPGDTIRE